FLLHLFSRFTDIPVGQFGHTLIDAHIYTAKPDGSMAEYDHIPGLQAQLRRSPRALPTLHIDPRIRQLDDINALLELET
ncbi:thymidylate synthase, partial [Streptococcus pyogenes]